MKTRNVCMLSAAVLMGGLAHPVMAAAAGSANDSTSRSLPVLVSVDSQGKVTDVVPAFRLSSAMMTQLDSTLDQMITRPAYRDGHPVDSQFAMILTTHATKLNHDAYAVKFDYVSAKPVPPGHWSWNYNGEQYTLIDTSYLQATLQIAQSRRDHARMQALFADQAAGHPMIPHERKP